MTHKPSKVATAKKIFSSVMLLMQPASMNVFCSVWKKSAFYFLSPQWE